MNCDKCGAPCYLSADGDLLFDDAEQDSSKINKTCIGHARNNMAGFVGPDFLKDQANDRK